MDTSRDHSRSARLLVVDDIEEMNNEQLTMTQ